MKTIGIIGAMSEEITYLKEKIEIVTTKNIIGLDFHVGKYCGNSIVLVISGIGKVNAAVCTQILADDYHVDAVVNTGIAGSLRQEINIGDIVISKEKVIAQAEEYGHSVKREYAFLIAHSVLHLSGYDHMEEEERIEMETLQREILNELNILR